MNGNNSVLSTRHKLTWYTLAVAATLLFCPLRGAAQDGSPTPVQIVALDECDPTTFNADSKADPKTNPNPGLGPDFCRNITIGAFTTLGDLFKQAKEGTPDPGWDFEPDTLKIKKGTPIVVVDQGGEPHTFTEVKHFGGGFIPDLNSGAATVPECNGGFKNVAVARTRILQGSQLLVGDLSKGEHYFQCCIHPWMRVTVDVNDHGSHDK